MDQAKRAVMAMFSEAGDVDNAQEASHYDPLSIGVWTIPEMGCYGLTKEQAEKEGYSVVEGTATFDHWKVYSS
jgi:pyruvate/2-oxoglutarate dehydrogenase complex dihydrolipoamide dehydrogenase (E3) component